jgi:Ser/Thr protein kinase RdoA (MazF antagonist)
LDALDTLGIRGDGRVLQLNSYENRVYQVHLEEPNAPVEAVVVAKFYRPGRWSDAQILEEHAFALALAAQDIPVVAPLELRPTGQARTSGQPGTLGHGAELTSNGHAHRSNGHAHRIAVTPRKAGRSPNLEKPDTLRWLGRYLARLHTVGEREPFVHRRTLDTATFGHAAQQQIAALSHLDDEAGRDAWLRVCAQALSSVDEAFDRLTPVKHLRLHGDLHVGNVLWREEGADGTPAGPHLVDLDDACMGPAVQDLWMLLSGDARALQAELGTLLDGYRLFRDFDERELALIEPLRTLRMIHHSAWIAQRWSDPAFPAAFPWFGTPGYWGQQATQLREQIAIMRGEG